MPMNFAEAPGGAQSLEQVAGGALESIQKDQQVLKALEMPGIKESMGDEIVSWISTGPGAHQRMGQYLANADKASGGKITRLGDAMREMEEALQGQPYDPIKHEATAYRIGGKYGFTNAEIKEQINRQSPKLLGSEKARATAAGKPKKDPKAGRLKRLGEIQAKIVKLRRGDTSAADEAMIRLIGERDPAKAERLRGILTGPEVDLGPAIEALEEEAAYLEGLGSPAPAPTSGGGTIRVIRKSDGQPGSIPEAEFDPALYDKE